MPFETVSLEGHIIDSLTLSKVLDTILRVGGQYQITKFDVGSTKNNLSKAEIKISADTEELLQQILHLVQQHGALRSEGEISTLPAPADGVLPDDFYATTNLETSVRIKGIWRPIEQIEMDCAIVLRNEEVLCLPMHQVKQGDEVVVGDIGVRVDPLQRRDPTDSFSFMESDVSTERNKTLIIAAIAQSIKTCRNEGSRILFVGGPAIIHTGAGLYLEQLILGGWIDVLFAGNALAAHDIERSLYGTSLGVELSTGNAVAHGHEHHLRAINTIRGAGGIKQAVTSGMLTSGIMHACITKSIDFVLAGSIRDDGPLPDVISDSIAAQDAMRKQVKGLGIALMVATTLHSVATGNMLPAHVRTVCVDSDADSVIKLLDRGTHQAFGLVTDCEYFLKELVSNLRGLAA